MEKVGITIDDIRAVVYEIVTAHLGEQSEILKGRKEIAQHIKTNITDLDRLRAKGVFDDVILQMAHGRTIVANKSELWQRYSDYLRGTYKPRRR